jgi:hypothetical protein
MAALQLALMTPLAAAGSEVAESSRTREILRYDCWSDLGRREVTLFANGTVRVREGLKGEEVISLGELSPEEHGAFLRRLQEEDLQETEGEYSTVQGEWVERCTLELDLPGESPSLFRFGRYDSLSLDLRRVVGIAMEISLHVNPWTEGSRLPGGYAPQPGDILRRTDGALFEVIGFTADKLGVELSGIDQPLTVYILVDELRSHFVAVEARHRWP